MKYIATRFPIKLEYWYIINFGDFYHITLYPVYFINKVSAKRAISRTFAKKKQNKYQVISGNKLKVYEEDLRYELRLGRMQKFSKYDYPAGMTDQEKKNQRTIIRRRLRRMGMLIPKKHKYYIKEKVKQNRLLINRQKVANSPNTEARAFRLERKPKYYYYIIQEKVRVSGNGVAFKVKSIRYNQKTGKYKKVLLNIYNKDVIIPHLISEVYSIALNNGNYDQFKRYCHNKGIRVYRERSEKVLQRMV